MPYISPQRISPADLSHATDGDLLDDIDGLVLDGTNLADGSIRHEHFAVTQATSPAAGTRPITTWVDTAVVGTGSQTISDDIFPGELVSLGSDLSLSAPNTDEAVLRTGDVLRWHGMVRITEIDDSGFPENDLYHVVVRVRGHGSTGGSVWKTGANDPRLGIIHTYSMNAARLEASSDGAGADSELWDQWVSFSGVYIHDAAASPWAGTSVSIDDIEVRVYVETAVNSVTIEAGTLTAMIIKG